MESLTAMLKLAIVMLQVSFLHNLITDELLTVQFVSNVYPEKARSQDHSK